MTREPGSAPPRHAHGDLTSLAPHERLPELPVIPREKPNTGATDRENPRDAPIFATWRPSFLAWPGEQSRVLSPNSTGGLTPFRPLSGLQEIPVATREESGVLRFPSRQGLTPWVSQHEGVFQWVGSLHQVAKADYDLEQQRQGKSGSIITSPFWSLDDNNKWTECANDVSHQRRSRVSTLPQVHLPRGWPATWAWLWCEKKEWDNGVSFLRNVT